MKLSFKPLTVVAFRSALVMYAFIYLGVRITYNEGYNNMEISLLSILPAMIFLLAGILLLPWLLLKARKSLAWYGKGWRASLRFYGALLWRLLLIILAIDCLSFVLNSTMYRTLGASFARMFIEMGTKPSDLDGYAQLPYILQGIFQNLVGLMTGLLMAVLIYRKRLQKLIPS